MSSFEYFVGLVVTAPPEMEKEKKGEISCARSFQISLFDATLKLINIQLCLFPLFSR